MKIIILVVVLAIAGAMAWVRLAPSDPSVWHAMPAAITNHDLPGGAMRIYAAGDKALARFDGIAMQTPRTHRLAGSVEDGMITYVTRSAVFGFPDYTTVRDAGPQLEIYGRLRFGRSDFGVNAARIDNWLWHLAEGG